MKAYILATLTLFSVVGARGDTITWTATADGNWSVSSNWNPSQVPGSADDVVLSQDVRVLVSSSQSAQSVSISTGTLRAGTSGFLTVDDVVQTGGMVETRTGSGTLTVNDDYDATAGMLRVIQGNKDAVMIGGDLTATSGFRFDYNMNGNANGIGRTVVDGETTLGGAELTLRNFVHNELDVILLMQNTSANAVVGSFDVAWGTTYDLGAEVDYELKLYDFDQDGNLNDVVLEAIPEPATIGLVVAFGGTLLIVRRKFIP